MSFITPAMQASFQRAIDATREHLKNGVGGNYRFEHPSCPAPVDIFVRPDGISWLVTVKCGERTLWTTGEPQSVNPADFLNGLYVFVVASLKAASLPARSMAS